MTDNEDFRKSIACAPLVNSIVVQAGPGSGKTTLLIERLKYIIENRVNSISGIACITYTNAAKDEIVMRLQDEGIKLPMELFIGTIHAFLLDYLIKPYSYIFNRGEPFKLAPLGFSRGYKHEIVKMLKRPSKYVDDSTHNALESLGYDEKGRVCCFKGKIEPKIAVRWKSLIHSNGYIDQQDVINLSYRILHQYEHIRKALSSRFPYFLVDEYQDVTFDQEQVFALLESSSFFCVGDINQSIYSFTGAKPDMFKEKWEDRAYRNYSLSNNFRSTELIVQFANRKTKIVQMGVGENAPREQKVLFFKGIEQVSDAIKLFHHVRRNIECDAKYKSFMVLARKNGYVNEISFILKEQDMTLNPFLKTLKSRNYRVFKILQNLLLAISYKRKNEFNKAVEKMEEAFSYLFFNEMPNYINLAKIKYDQFMWRKLQIFTLSFLDNIVLTETSVADFFLRLKEFLTKTSMNKYGLTIGRNVLMLNHKWTGQINSSKRTMLSYLVEQAELQENLSDSEGNVFSIHSAKGLEAECVLVLAETEAQLMEWLDDNKRSEEARVGYVAFSRARKLLCVWAPNMQEESYSHLQQYVEFLEVAYTVEVESV
ncbi:DNA helicase UvrD [Bacillus anthracis]|nr:DNA helicase UvrD [Bacillus anthracis]PGX28287.1 DNA helicase UvrD [Bacillus anthracis]